jgi:hypothetical protein
LETHPTVVPSASFALLSLGTRGRHLRTNNPLSEAYQDWGGCPPPLPLMRTSKARSASRVSRAGEKERARAVRPWLFHAPEFSRIPVSRQLKLSRRYKEDATGQPPSSRVKPLLGSLTTDSFHCILRPLERVRTHAKPSSKGLSQCSGLWCTCPTPGKPRSRLSHRT